MKKICLILLMLCTLLSVSAELKIIIDENRFLDQDLNTILEINYQIPYNNLQFQKNEKGFEALLNVDFKVFSAEQIVYSQEFSNQIILADQDRTETEDNFLDKISLSLSRSDFTITLDFTDLNSSDSYHWEYEFTRLEQTALLSDLEFSYDVRIDTTDFLQKFHRWDYLFLVNPSHIFDLQKNQSGLIYYEISGFFKGSEDLSDLTEVITIKKGDVIVKSDTSHIAENKDLINRIKHVDLLGLEAGYYTLEIELQDNISGFHELKQDFFSIKNSWELAVRIFPDMEDDYKLIKYFLPTSQTKIWKELTVDGKRNFLSRFWELNDPDPQTENNEFLELIKDRVAYSNKNFSHHEAGWTSDMGRIFIKNGQPDEVLKERTGFYTKYATKDYEIWKYRSGEIYNYIFIDILTSGNFKLIYSENDDTELTLPDWQNYLDEDFDESLLN